MIINLFQREAVNKPHLLISPSVFFPSEKDDFHHLIYDQLFGLTCSIYRPAHLFHNTCARKATVKKSKLQQIEETSNMDPLIQIEPTKKRTETKKKQIFILIFQSWNWNI